MRKILFGLFTSLTIFVGFFAFNFYAKAQEVEKVNVYVFHSKGCSHCARELEYLDELIAQRSDIELKTYEVSQNRDNALLMKEVAYQLRADAGGVPFTVIGSEYFIGFGSADTTGKEFIAAIDEVSAGKDYDFIAEKALIEEKVEAKPQKEVKEGKEIDLSFFGKINSASFSLPVITFMIALVDGFNPCAMWVLVFLISMLLGYKDRKRMWILGTTFIAASAFVYFLIMVAWLKVFMLFEYLSWIRLIVGSVALFFGYQSIKSFIKNKDGGCEVTKDEKRVKILNRIKEITQKESMWLAVGGIILLAFAVNLIEAVCSFGLPAIYTQILAMNELSTAQYYLYILFYQIIFMLDDMVVFTIAMVTLNSVGIESKYARWIKIIGGIITIIIGILLIFKPELLFFG